MGPSRIIFTRSQYPAKLLEVFSVIVLGRAMATPPTRRHNTDRRREPSRPPGVPSTELPRQRRRARESTGRRPSLRRRLLRNPLKSLRAGQRRSNNDGEIHTDACSGFPEPEVGSGSSSGPHHRDGGTCARFEFADLLRCLDERANLGCRVVRRHVLRFVPEEELAIFEADTGDP